jgi:hypothetical protein
MRRVAILLVAAAVLGAGAIAGPAHAAKDKKIKSCQKDKNINANIQAAFVPFFTGETAADRVKNVQDGSKIQALVEESTNAVRAAGQVAANTVTYPVEINATCDGKKAATFKYDLALNQPKPVTNPPSTGIGLEFAGDAVLVKGKWVITALTICDLIGANPNTPGLGERCQKAALG